MIIVCKMCQSPFKHLSVHKFSNAKKFCDECLKIRKHERNTDKSLKIHKKPLKVKKEIIPWMLWDQSLDCGGLL